MFGTSVSSGMSGATICLVRAFIFYFFQSTPNSWNDGSMEIRTHQYYSSTYCRHTASFNWIDRVQADRQKYCIVVRRFDAALSFAFISIFCCVWHIYQSNIIIIFFRFSSLFATSRKQKLGSERVWNRAQPVASTQSNKYVCKCARVLLNAVWLVLGRRNRIVISSVDDIVDIYSSFHTTFQFIYRKWIVVLPAPNLVPGPGPIDYMNKHTHTRTSAHSPASHR